MTKWRDYTPVAATDPAEAEAERKARHADRERRRYAAMTPAERQQKSDQVGDHRWMQRQIAKGVPEGEALAALKQRVADREARRAAESTEELKTLPNFGVF